ncbi:hypothetical protein ACO34A_11300 [Rhizobium sp. ACO-34A]|nr:hypothetical protein ACO34A_11300 [Rhizobium sp. ACO-34A]
MARDRRRVACRICAHALAAPQGEWQEGEKSKSFSVSLPAAPNCRRHSRAGRVKLNAEQTRCSGASKPLTNGWCRPLRHRTP